MPVPRGGQPTKRPVTKDPFRSVSNLVANRVDAGVDYTGNGPIFAIAPGTIRNVWNSGWPGGVFIQEHITGGPYRGEDWYFAEDIKPNVSVGDRVTSNDVIGNMYSGGSIETGWADPKIPGNALAFDRGHMSFPTPEGLSANRVLVSLGAPSGTVNGRPALKGHYKGPVPANLTSAAKSSQGCGSFWGALTSGITGNPGGLSAYAACKFGQSTLGSGWATISNFLANPVDLFERLGLILFGGTLIIVGLVVMARGDAKTILPNEKLFGGSPSGPSGSGMGPGRPPRERTPEEKADRERRLQLAEKNAEIGRVKVTTAAAKEARLSGRASYPNKRPTANARSKPANRRATTGEHKPTGGREPNPTPVHG